MRPDEQNIGDIPKLCLSVFSVYSLATGLPLHEILSDIFLLSLSFNFYRLSREKILNLFREFTDILGKMRMLEKKGENREEIFMGGGSVRH